MQPSFKLSGLLAACGLWFFTATTEASIVQSALAPGQIGISVTQLFAATPGDSIDSSLRPSAMAAPSQAIHLGTHTDLFAIGAPANYSEFWVRYQLDGSSYTSVTDPYTQPPAPATTRNAVTGELWLAFNGSTLTVDSSRINGDSTMALNRVNILPNPLSQQSFTNSFGSPFACDPQSQSGCAWNSTLNLAFLSVKDGTLYTSDIGFDVLFTEHVAEGVSVDRQYNIAPVPAPMAVWLMGSGLAGMFGLLRRRSAPSSA